MEEVLQGYYINRLFSASSSCTSHDIHSQINCKLFHLRHIGLDYHSKRFDHWGSRDFHWWNAICDIRCYKGYGSSKQGCNPRFMLPLHCVSTAYGDFCIRLWMVSLRTICWNYCWINAWVFTLWQTYNHYELGENCNADNRTHIGWVGKIKPKTRWCWKWNLHQFMIWWTNVKS